VIRAPLRGRPWAQVRRARKSPHSGADSPGFPVLFTPTWATVTPPITQPMNTPAPACTRLRKSRNWRSWAVRGLLLGLGLGISPTIQAQTYTWTGSTNHFWDTTSADWSGAGTVWVNDATSQAVFAATLGYQVALNSDITANTVTMGTGNNFNGNGHTLTLTGTSPGLLVSGTNSLFFSAPILGSSGLTVTGVGGSGRLDLSGVSGYTGPTTVNSATLSLVGGNNRLPIGTDVALNGSAILLLQGITQHIGALTGGSGAAAINGLSTPATLQIDGSASGALYTGRFLVSSGTTVLSITKEGTGTQILGGSATNNYLGSTQINEGLLIAAKNSAFSTSAVTVAAGGTWGLQGGITQSNTGSIAGAGLSGRAGAVDNIGEDNSMTGALTLTDDATIGTTDGNLTLSGGITAGSHSLTFNPASGSTITVQTGAITGAATTLALTKAGPGTLILSSANSYTGQTDVVAGILDLENAVGSASGMGGMVISGADTRVTGTGSISGLLNLAGGIVAPTAGARLTFGSFLWHGGTRIEETIGGTFIAPVQIGGPLEKGSPGSYTIALTDGGVTPGTTYTLMTFASNSGFSASDFTVTGIAGTLSLEANALKFSVPALPFYGVAVAVANGKNSATFTITNTGNTTTTFRVLPGALVTGKGGKNGSQPSKGGKKPTYKVLYLLNGADISAAVAAGSAHTAGIAPGASAQVVVKLKVLKKATFKRKVTAKLLVISDASASTSAAASAKFVIKADKK